MALFPEQLQKLGHSRLLEIYPTQDLAPHKDNNLLQLLALSDFAYDILAKEPTLGLWLVEEETENCREIPSPLVLSELGSLSQSDCFSQLRQYRNRYWLKVAYLDLVIKNPIEDSIAYISKLSDTLIHSAYLWAYEQVSLINGKPLNKQAVPMPMLILGMGKLGGFELNYSSDIDLIFTYPKHCETQGGRKSIEAQVFFNKVAQKLIAALNQVTPQGQVFRVDMRLRPFGDSGPLVMSFNAMEEYYQEQGRDWERYAMLKSRLIGESSVYTDKFTALLKPFVYRRYIDFSVIESLRKMKFMIAQEVRRNGLLWNIKLGAGGIREVEFVVQAFQMIRGGRDPVLQTQSLLQALIALEKLGVLDPTTIAQLKSGYLYLRKIEQYLQIFNNEQTQSLPIDTLNQLRLSWLLNKNNFAAVQSEISHTMAQVHNEFNLMIGTEKEPEDNEAAEYITAWEQSDITVLQEINGSETQKKLWQSELDNFHAKLNKIKIGARGRDILDKLMPQILQQLVLSKCTERVFHLVSDIIIKVASRTAYLELLFENLGALKQLVKLCQHSQWIGEHLARYPILLDELIDPAQLYKPPSLSAYTDEIRHFFLRIDDQDLERQMEALRQFKQTHQLRIAAADATGVLAITKVSEHLTALSEAIVMQSIEIAWRHMVDKFGYPHDASEQEKGFAVIAYGKAGGIELGYDSDLDLVFVHNSNNMQMTSGAREIDSRQFYLKLAQRLMHLFNTRTASGILYELDTRLRPEGASGLLAINIETFLEYQINEAWTWEHQALVRARMIYGQENMRLRFNDIRAQVLSLSRDKVKLKQEVCDMRAKMRTHLAKGNEVLFDLKQDKGAMADIEFIAQYIVLANSNESPQIMTFSDNIRIFHSAAKLNIISIQQSEQLIQAYCDYRQQYHVLSLRNEARLVENQLIAQHKLHVCNTWDAIFGL